MNNSSYFIKNRGLFGSYPTQASVKELEQVGVRHFVNLTCDGEKRISPYTVSSNSTILRYAIRDHGVPRDVVAFSKFVLRVTEIITTLPTGHLVYIHCRGGHGRAGVVVAILLAFIFDVKASIALAWTNRFHSRRPMLKEKWRVLGSPQTCQQKRFVLAFFSPIKLYRLTYKNRDRVEGFSRMSAHPIVVDDVEFPCLELALLAKKFPSHLQEFVALSDDACVEDIVRRKRKQQSPVADWNRVRKSVLDELTFLKFEQHPHLKENLLRSGLRPIILLSRMAFTWLDGTGDNVTGEALMTTRKKIMHDN